MLFLLSCFYFIFGGGDSVSYKEVGYFYRDIKLVLISAYWDYASMEQLSIYNQLKIQYSKNMDFKFLNYSSQGHYSNKYANFDSVPSYYIFYGNYKGIKYEGPKFLRYLQIYIYKILYDLYTHIKSKRDVEYLYKSYQHTLLYCTSQPIYPNYEQFINQILIYISRNLESNTLGFGVVTDHNKCGLGNVNQKTELFVLYNSFTTNELYFTLQEKDSLIASLEKYTEKKMTWITPQELKDLAFVKDNQVITLLTVSNYIIPSFDVVYTQMFNIYQNLLSQTMDDPQRGTFINTHGTENFELYNQTVSNCVLLAHANESRNRLPLINSCYNIDMLNELGIQEKLALHSELIEAHSLNPSFFVANARQLTEYIRRNAFRNDIDDGRLKFWREEFCPNLLKYHQSRDHLSNVSHSKNNETSGRLLSNFLYSLRNITYHNVKGFISPQSLHPIPRGMGQPLRFAMLDPDVGIDLLCSILGTDNVANFTSHLPAIIAINSKERKKYVLEGERFSQASILSFILNITHLSQAPYVKSVANTPLGYVLEMNGLNFESIVFNLTKDVIVFYYTHYCGYCQSVYHVYLKLARDLGVSNLLFTSINCANNDLPEYVHVNHYPSLVYYPAFRKTSNISYPTDFLWNYTSLSSFVVGHLISQRMKLTSAIMSKMNFFDLHRHLSHAEQLYHELMSTDSINRFQREHEIQTNTHIENKKLYKMYYLKFLIAYMEAIKKVITNKS